MRLGGFGSSDTKGYVEGLGPNGQWGGICDDDFDINDAKVICRMLGFNFTNTALANSTADDLNVSASKALSKHLFWNIKIQMKC